MACCYENCTNTRKKNPNLTFFRFPKERERRYLWMKKCKNISIQNLSFEELQNRVVCEEHFLPKCFDYSVLTSGKTRRSLFKFAVPQPAEVIAAYKQESSSILSCQPFSKMSSDTESDDLDSAENSFLTKNKDLVSPQSLMNITENLCLLVPPISPPPPTVLTDNACRGFDSNLGMSSHDKGKEDTCFLSEEKKKIFDFVSYPTSSSSALTTVTTSVVTTTASSNITTTALTSFTNTTNTVHSAPTYVALKRVPSKDCIPKKYKKILPKTEIEKESNMVLSSGEDVGKTSDNVVLNLRGLNINKLEKAPKGTSTSKTTTLLLDNNLLQMLPMIDSYSKLTKLSLANNQVDSFIWFGRLTSLRVLNLSGNKISDMDGLWRLWHLTHVDLSGNLIEVVKCQTGDTKSNLEYLDISNNKISRVEDISMASNLKELLLHKNKIITLSYWKSFLPKFLMKLTLEENLLSSLGDIKELSSLELLKELTLKGNTCVNVLQLVDLQGNPVGPPRCFDYRPFVVAMCPYLVTLDHRQVNDYEKRKAGWLLLQDKFKQVSLQSHSTLVSYLSDVCLLSTMAHEDEFGKENNEISAKKTFSQDPSQIEPKSTVLDIVSMSKCSKNNASMDSVLHKTCKVNSKKYLKKKKESLSKLKEAESDCANRFPCKHYIELIEERARNYKLKRRNESLSEENINLYHRLQVLETTLTENGISVRDVKIEVEDEGLEEEYEDGT